MPLRKEPVASCVSYIIIVCRPDEAAASENGTPTLRHPVAACTGCSRDLPNMEHVSDMVSSLQSDNL